MDKKNTPPTNKPEVHHDLKGFDIKINQFGEVISSIKPEKLNEFLNENVDDKKLKDENSESVDS